MKVSLFEVSYKKKWTFSRYSNLLRCTCTTIFVSLQSEQQLDKMLKDIKNCADEHKDEFNVNGL